LHIGFVPTKLTVSARIKDKFVIVWVESQPAATIALLAFGVSYLMVGLIFAAAVALSTPIATDLKATTPTMLTPLSVITGLLIAFLAARVWSNLDRANTYIAQEASSIRDVIVLSRGLPSDIGAVLRGSMAAYLHFVQSDEWPAMATSQAQLGGTPPGLTEAMRTMLAFNAATRSQEIAQQQIIRAVERTLEARRYRILLSEGVISPVQWLVIFALDILLLMTVAMVHIDRRKTVVVNMVMLASAVAACLVLLMVHDRPFAAGGFTLEPAALRQIDLEQ
jgi:hypothetical protein